MSIEKSKNNDIILFALSMIIFMLLNSAGDTEARPTNASQSYISKEKDTDEWREKLVEDLNSVGEQESGIQAEKRPVIQLDTAEDKDTIEWIEKLENSQTDKQEGGIQEVSDVGETDIKETQTSHISSSARKARNTSNACIQRYKYYVIYNIFFAVPVCKNGCKTKYRTVSFSNGKTLAIAKDCYI